MVFDKSYLLDYLLLITYYLYNIVYNLKFLFPDIL